MKRRSLLQVGLLAAGNASAKGFSDPNDKLAEVAEGSTLGAAGRNLVGASTYDEVRKLLNISGRWGVTLPYRSQMDRIREDGITPDDVVGTIVSGDAGPAISGMLAEGLNQRINRFKFMAGKTYEVNSWDASDATRAYGIFRTEETSDITIDLNGGTLKGLNGIRESKAHAGAIARLESAYTTDGEDTIQRFILKNGKVDLTECTPSTPGIATIGGVALIGRWNVELDGVLFDHGRRAASGDAIGVGGGDQSFFASNWNSLKITRCIFRGAPDLGVYLSNSGGRRAELLLSTFIGCQNAVGVKRFASLLRMYGCRVMEGDIGVYNPVADDDTDNMGGRMDIEHCLIEKMQSRPIDINALADGSSVRNTEIWDWGRRLSDGAETSLSERLWAIRVRSRRVMLNNVRMGMRDWALNTTSGKEQVGIIYSYNGSAGVMAGAEDCIHSDCYFENLYQRVRYDNVNTVRNADGKGNRGYRITASDTDLGRNIFPIVLTDDIATSVLMPSNYCAVHLECQTTTNGSPNGEIHVNTTGSPAVTNINLKLTTNINFTTGVLANAGGKDGQMNLSAHTDGKLYISNRTGNTVSMRISFPRE